jgi:Ca-activated chloride channel family protein
MIGFVHPWAVVLLPLPALVHGLLLPFRQVQSGVRVPLFGQLVRISGETPGTGAVALRRRPWQTAVLVVCWLCIVLA